MTSSGFVGFLSLGQLFVSMTCNSHQGFTRAADARICRRHTSSMIPYLGTVPKLRSCFLLAASCSSAALRPPPESCNNHLNLRTLPISARGQLGRKAAGSAEIAKQRSQSSATVSSGLPVKSDKYLAGSQPAGQIKKPNTAPQTISRCVFKISRRNKISFACHQGYWLTTSRMYRMFSWEPCLL